MATTTAATTKPKPTKQVDRVAQALSDKVTQASSDAINNMTVSTYNPKHFGWALIATAIVVLMVAKSLWGWSTESAITEAKKKGVEEGISQQETKSKEAAAKREYDEVLHELQEAKRKLATSGGGLLAEVPAKKQ